MPRAAKSIIGAIIAHFSTAPIAEAKKDLDVAREVVKHRETSAAAGPTHVVGKTRKRDRKAERARAAAKVGTGAAQAADRPAGRKRGRPAGSKNKSTDTAATTETAAAGESQPALPDPGNEGIGEAVES